MKAVIITYVVKRGREKDFEKILRKHWRLLRSEKLTTEQPPFLLKDPENPTVYKEVFQWRAGSATKAHSNAKVQKIWKEMEKLTVDGGIEPAHFERL